MIELRALNADRHRDLALDFAKAVNAVVASHDDTTAADVDLAVKTGTRIAEFPTTMEAASLCHDNGISVMMGAPNLIRGGSHSGNVAAVDLVKHGFLHILSSDYVPASLLKSAVQFGQMMNDLAAGIASVTEIPARAAGLDDRGSLAVGLRGDLLRFAVIDGRPIIRGVWCAGRQVA
jgi:alpha-D-ribose 1-methylphosphonate 5-triphosphate diphosphatase